jgi:CubicO group peptidase (beta-lactamase class C family)
MPPSFLRPLALLALAACGGASVAPPAAPAAPASPPLLPAPPAPDPAAELAAKIDPLFAKYAKPGSPGCAVGVFRAGEIVFAKGYGYANLEHGIPIGPSTAFELASMSKQFTAASILLLAQDGKLGLDDDVRKYVPEVPDYGHTITLRHLLHHTGGLREYDPLLDLSGFDVADVATEGDALRLVGLQRGVNFAPGAEWSYSNTGYFLLSYVVKRVGGRSLAAFEKERIFDPLGMKDTMTMDDHTLIVPHRATGYVRREDGSFAIEMSGREQTGEGNIQSTIEDLARWDGNFYEPKVGGAAWPEAMRTPGKLADGRPLTYAMGLSIGTRGGVAEEQHSGGWAGYVTQIRRFPSERLTVACLCNVADARPGTLTASVADVVLPKLAAPPPPAPSPVMEGPGSPPKPPGDVDGRADLSALVGAYLDRRSFRTITVSLREGALEVALGIDPDARGPKIDVMADGTLSVRGTPVRYAVERGSGKAPPSLARLDVKDRPSRFERFQVAAVDAAALAEYAGRWTSDETTHDVELRVVEGRLRFGPWGKQPWKEPLAPLERDAFLGGPGAILFERDGRKRVHAMVAVMDGRRAVRWTKR